MIDRVLVLLIAGCAVFGGVIAAELLADDVPDHPPAPAAAPAEPARTARVASVRGDDLVGAILDRPLFSPNRQPPAREGGERTTETGLNDVRLTGTVIE